MELRKKRWLEGLSKHSVYTKSALYWALGVNSITLFIAGGTNQNFLSHKLEAVRDCIYNGPAFPIFGR